MKGKICILLSIVLLILAICTPHMPGETASAARKVERIMSDRLAILEKYADRALNESPYEWTEIGEIPGDMVVYRYLDDSIQCWINQFSVANDDISGGPLSQRLMNPGISVTSPLSEISEDYGFYNFGPKWYLARCREEGQVKVLFGLTLTNSLDTRTFNGINPVFHIGDRYSFKPLSSSEGSVVCVDGNPVFKVQYESLNGSTATSNGLLIWLAFALFVVGSVLLLLENPALKQMKLLASGLLLAVCALFLWGRSVQEQYVIFSPTVYADGVVFYSLGAIILINIVISLLSAYLFIVRKSIFNSIRTRRSVILSGLSVVLAVVLIAVYTHFSLKSIILNSNISLELYKLETLSGYSFLVLASYLVMLTSIPMLLMLIRPSLRLYFGIHFDPLSSKSRIIYAILVSLYMVVLTSLLGFRKEQDRLEVVANRLAVDRDIALELQLRRAEKDISSDPVIASLTLIQNGEASILHRLSDMHLARLSQNYNISVFLDPSAVSMVQGGEPVSEESCFSFFQDKLGHSYYAGVFFYNIPGYGLRSLTVLVEPRIDANDRGYASLLGLAPPGSVSVPPQYSYAHYDGRQILHYKGNYAYSTRMDDKLYARVYEDKLDSYNSEGYTHFINRVGDGEALIITRESIGAVQYLIADVMIALACYLIISLLAIGWRRRESARMQNNSYRTKINWVMMISLILTLMAMTLVSVIFVYRRNDSNQRSIMSEKINSIQSMLGSRVYGARSIGELLQSNPHLLEEVGNNSNTDITLYAPDGCVVLSTVPRIYERYMVGSRINGTAFNNIMYEGRRYFIQKERIGSHEYYSMYAPLMSDDGNVLAIICAPYADDSYDFERDAITHSMMIVSVFLILLLLARFATSSVVDRMFKPLSEMGRKMNNAGLDSIEKIEYDRNDEISSLVDAYNRMADELTESTKQLAQAERDKAWSGMARQVAHEIKNPLTPMKLQLQRIMRLKARNDPSWQDKFDEMTKVLLDHIDILTDTANEFSTFAKLYTEEPSEIKLDEVLQEEISMFDCKGPVAFEYFGLEGAAVKGPKPQLTRVFVNLINNSVQALDGREDGCIRVSLRNSMRDGYYDIVFEDNGPGVSEYNVDKLFTPNFTTKNGGSGLGLAISKSILERCNASISYSKSFALGGACFTIQYPKCL